MSKETRREWLAVMSGGLMMPVVAQGRGGRRAGEGQRERQRGGASASGAQKPERLLLDDFQPKSALHVPEHRIEKPRFPVIDFHTHLTWSGRTADGRNDAEAITTIVPAGSLCASACASVVFVAGKYRTIQKGGQLAIHSCFDDRNGQKMDDCDALISARAEQEGISGRAMMAFQEMAPGPDSAIVFDPANAACFGLTRAPGKASLGDRAPCIVQAMKAAKRRR